VGYEDKLGLVKKLQSVVDLLQEALPDCGEVGQEKLKKAIDILKD
jgi:hypothetical protein